MRENRNSGIKQYIITAVLGVISSLVAWALTENFKIASLTLFIFLALSILSYFLYKKFALLVVFKRCSIVNVSQNQYLAEKDIKEKLRNARHIDILTIRGLGIFGLKDSILRHFLIENAGNIKIRILFLNPRSKYCEIRSKEIGEDKSTFISGIAMCQESIKELKEKYSINIEARMYDSLPIWRMHFIDKFLFVSSYLPQKNGHETFMYEITTTGDDYSLFDTFKREFDFLFQTATKFI